MQTEGTGEGIGVGSVVIFGPPTAGLAVGGTGLAVGVAVGSAGHSFSSILPSTKWHDWSVSRPGFRYALPSWQSSSICTNLSLASQCSFTQGFNTCPSNLLTHLLDFGG